MYNTITDRCAVNSNGTTRLPFWFLSYAAVKRLAMVSSLLLPIATASLVTAAEEREPAEVYRQVCSHCHNLDKAVGPMITMPFPEGAWEARGNHIRTTVRQGRAAMPSFREAKISDAELEGLIDALLRGELANTATGEE
ncbi:c-type cytochrome [Vreelandella sulfidaeris]